MTSKLLSLGKRHGRFCFQPRSYLRHHAFFSIHARSQSFAHSPRKITSCFNTPNIQKMQKNSFCSMKKEEKLDEQEESLLKDEKPKSLTKDKLPEIRVRTSMERRQEKELKQEMEDFMDIREEQGETTDLWLIPKKREFKSIAEYDQFVRDSLVILTETKKTEKKRNNKILIWSLCTVLFAFAMAFLGMVQGVKDRMVDPRTRIMRHRARPGSPYQAQQSSYKSEM